jgi:hypothetical protein
MGSVGAFFEATKVALTMWATTFWDAATEPLKHLRIETGVLLALAILVAWLVARFVRSASWRFSHPVIRGMQIASTPHTNNGTIALSFEDYIRKFASDAEIFLVNNTARVARDRWGAERHKKVHSEYFVVTLVECDPDSSAWTGTPVMTRELKVWRKTNPPPEGCLQLDRSCLRDVRDLNLSSADNVEGAAIQGKYDLYMRKVNFWDIRHWLVHPNREIRIALWVTIISMVVPVFFDALFK